jgi:hypothetical protein
MPKYPSFSHAEYKHILMKIYEKLPIIDYLDIDEKTNTFCVIRHDVEFSLERAYSLAKIENGLGIVTSYFIQIDNNTYNALSVKNVEIINKIKSMGHKIGIHFHPTSLKVSRIKNDFLRYKKILEEYVNQKVDRFSFHRPNLNPLVLKKNVKIQGAINVYDSLFFQYFDGVVPEHPNIKYISDSNHQWRYGHPLEAIEKGHKKIQILFHPFSWSEKGGDNLENYRSLFSEKVESALNSINSEIANFPMEDISKFFMDGFEK